MGRGKTVSELQPLAALTSEESPVGSLGKARTDGGGGDLGE